MSLVFRNLFRINNNILQIRRSTAYYNKDWKPGPYPKNAEERAAAAKKYGLRPEDYMPYPDDGLAPGDYPYIKPFSYEHRDPWEFYDYYPHRMNYKEALPLSYEIYKEGMMDPEVLKTFQGNLNWKEVFFWTFFPFFVFMGIGIIFSQYKAFHPVMIKQFPYEGETHYLFEEPD